MKLNLVCTAEGFKPATDEDFEKKKTIKRGTICECTIKEVRNYKFHKKYFSLINCAWEYLTEEQQHFFYDSVDSFRKTVEISAGHCTPVYSHTRQEWLDMPKSVAFDSMTEEEFGKLYEKVKDVLYNIFLSSVNKEEFENELKYF